LRLSIPIPDTENKGKSSDFKLKEQGKKDDKKDLGKK
jgi:hypothetical protein